MSTIVGEDKRPGLLDKVGRRSADFLALLACELCFFRAVFCVGFVGFERASRSFDLPGALCIRGFLVFLGG